MTPRNVGIGDRFRFHSGNRAGEVHEVVWLGKRWMTLHITGGSGAEREEKTEISFAQGWTRVKT